MDKQFRNQLVEAINKQHENGFDLRIIINGESYPIQDFTVVEGEGILDKGSVILFPTREEVQSYYKNDNLRILKKAFETNPTKIGMIKYLKNQHDTPLKEAIQLVGNYLDKKSSEK